VSLPSTWLLLEPLLLQPTVSDSRRPRHSNRNVDMEETKEANEQELKSENEIVR
jgi:hypothetical protein